jgi:hypothetical protein
MPEPYARAHPAPPNPTGALLDEWNRQVNGGAPSHPLSVADEWIRPILPALRARAGQDSPLPLWRDCLTRWLEQKAGKHVRLLWFCRDVPDLLTAPAPVRKRVSAHPLFPLAKAPTTPVADAATTEAGLAHVRDVLRGIREVKP